MNNEIELSLFTYPYIENIVDNWRFNKYIDFDIDRDIPPGVKRMYFEFLYIYMETEDGLYDPQGRYEGEKCGVSIVNEKLPNWGAGTVGGYSPEYVKKINNKVLEPYITLSGRGSNLEYLLNQDDAYIERTIKYIINFTKNECDFLGVCINIEGLGDFTEGNQQILTDKYIKFLEDFTKAMHEENLKVIFTTPTEVFPDVDLEDNTKIKPRMHFYDNIPFRLTSIYHIDFDYINYMCIDNLWNKGDRKEGHYSYESLITFLDIISKDDPKFKERTTIQLSNYAMWGWTLDVFDSKGQYKLSTEERIAMLDNGDKRKYEYSILCKHQYEGLIKGNALDAGLYLYWNPDYNDIGWGLSTTPHTPTGLKVDGIEYAQFNRPYGWKDELTLQVLNDPPVQYRDPNDDTLNIILGEGYPNRRKNKQDYRGQTYLSISDKVTISNKMKFIYEHYGIKKFSIWHAHRDTVWFSIDAVNKLTNGTGYPKYKVVYPRPLPPPKEKPPTGSTGGAKTGQNLKKLFGGLPAMILGFLISRFTFCNTCVGEISDEYQKSKNKNNMEKK